MSNELKPCPFCGSNELELIMSEYIGDIPWLHHSIDCNGCPASMEVDGDEDLIIGKWNARMTEP